MGEPSDRPMDDRVHAGAPHGGYEPRDVKIGPLLGVLAALGIVIAVTLVLMRALLAAYDARPGAEAPRLAAEYGRSAPPEPRLQANPRDDLRRLRAEEDRLLHAYDWVDRDGKAVRIPIERAMELLAERTR